jgi:hypothetical protein
MYTTHIIQHSHLSNYSVQNQRDLVLDTAENLTQIGAWSLTGFTKEKSRIELFLKLTRKNLNALLSFPMTGSFDSDFKKFCDHYDKLEAEYKAGVVDHNAWAKRMIEWANNLSQSAKSAWS